MSHVYRSKAVLSSTIAIVATLVVALIGGHSAYAASPPSYFTRSYTYNGQTVTYHVIAVYLTDPGTFITPYGANNRLPRFDAYDPEPRWQGGGSHKQSVGPMYANAPFPDKYALINADYFCGGGCIGDAGAPQGMFVRDGTKYQWPGPHKRSALCIRATNEASITIFGPFQPPHNQDTYGCRQIISGGPILAQWEHLVQPVW